MKTHISLAIIMITSVASGASAQSNISALRKWSWGENIGWMNWRDADNGVQGVRLHDDYMSGFIWAENVGWINLGSGAPADGQAYTNTDGTDFGVNIDFDSGNLSGLAWGENIGWINFGTEATLSASNQHARLDVQMRRLRGYAWGENVGWINLDHAQHFVAERCKADFNDDGLLDIFDIFAFLNAFTSEESDADLAPDGQFDFFDVLVYMGWFQQGCP